MSKTVTAELRATMMDVANSTLSANEPSGDVVLMVSKPTR